MSKCELPDPESSSGVVRTLATERNRCDVRVREEGGRFQEVRSRQSAVSRQSAQWRCRCVGKVADD